MMCVITSVLIIVAQILNPGFLTPLRPVMMCVLYIMVTNLSLIMLKELVINFHDL